MMKLSTLTGAAVLAAVGSLAAVQAYADGEPATTPAAVEAAPAAQPDTSATTDTSAPAQAESTATTQAGGATDDAALAGHVKAALGKDPAIKPAHIKVDAQQGVVQLSGYVDTQAEIEAASRAAMTVEGVSKVENQLQVKPAP